MDERDIIRLNIERFRRMLQEKIDESTRRTIESLLLELEAKLKPPSTPPGEYC
jgi:hypothetical protein